MTEARRQPLPAVSWMGAGLAAAALIVSASLMLGVPDGLKLAARYTARLSFWWFLCAYLAGPMARLTGLALARVALLNRRGLGLGFATVHLVHLAALSAYLTSAHLQPRTTTLIAGGIAYGLLVAMIATSNDGARRYLGRQWRPLHLTGMHVLWLVFVLTLLGDMKASNVDHGVRSAMVVAAVGALALRLAATARGALRRPQAA